MLFILCNFAVESYAGGSMSCEKRFAKVLSWVGFGHIEIAFIALCVLLFETSQRSELQFKIRVTVNAYGYDYIHTMLVSRHSVLSYQRRFPVVY